jgi:hypothetical protein
MVTAQKSAQIASNVERQDGKITFSYHFGDTLYLNVIIWHFSLG